MRLIFMGTPDFAVPVLGALIAAGHQVAAVYTQPPRAAGRGQQPRPGPVAQAALAASLPWRHPVDFRDPAEVAAFADLGAEVAVVVAYGLILPPPVLAAPRLGCLNLHASLLPRWRGAAPIQRAIWAGDAQTGVCVMQMAAGLDTGPVRARAVVPLDDQVTAGALHDRLAALGADLMVGALAALAAGTLPSTPQPDAGITYAAKIAKAETRIDWTQPPARIAAQIRALSPAPGAWTQAGGERLKILAADPVPAPDGAPPGTVLDTALTIACGSDALRPRLIQRAGRAPLAVADLLRGFPLPPGTRLA